MDKRIQVRLVAARILRLVVSVSLLAVAGHVFNAGAQTVTILYSFGSSPTDGDGSPYAGLVQGSDGNFYGTIFYGGTNFAGSVFRISPGGSETNLYSFVGYPKDGAYPRAGLVQGSDGNFYGTTEGGGTCPITAPTDVVPYFGSVRAATKRIFTRLVANPTMDSSQKPGWYRAATAISTGRPLSAGRTVAIAARCFGSVRPATTHSFTPLAVPPPTGPGHMPGWRRAATEISTGRLSKAGRTAEGTVFRIGPSGAYTTLYSFGGVPGDGVNAEARLVRGSDGNLYGTTRDGGTSTNCGSYGCGTVFRVSPSGNETNLYSFGSQPNDGIQLFAGLVQGSDGNFYGTTGDTYWEQGPNNCGTVFRISSAGTLTTLWQFGCGTNGFFPYAGLVQGSDGNFYGTTTSGGAHGFGIVFRLSVPLNPPANQISEIQFFNVLDSTIVALPIPSVARETYQLQYTDSMSPVNWLNTGGTITSIGGSLVLIDLAEPLPPQRFYRAVITP